MCQDFTSETRIDKLPVISMDLRVTSCSDSSAILMGGSGPTYSVTIGDSGQYYLDPVETPFLAGAVNTFGLRVPGVGKLEDIEDFSLIVQNADICVSKIELIVNEIVVYEKTFEPFKRLVGTLYPTVRDHLDITGDELRSFWRQIDPTVPCGIPTGVSGPALQRTIESLLGHALKKAGGSTTNSGGAGVTLKRADLHDDDFVLTEAVDNRTLRVDTRFHASLNVAAGDALGVDTDVTVRLMFDIVPTCMDPDPDDQSTANAVSLEVSPITVVEVDGDILVDLVVALVEPEGDIAASLNERLDDIRGSFANVVEDLAICPEIAVQGPSPASISLAFNPFILAAAQASGEEVHICR